MYAVFKSGGEWDSDAVGFITIVPAVNKAVICELQKLHADQGDQSQLIGEWHTEDEIDAVIDRAELSCYFTGDPSAVFEFSSGDDIISEFWVVLLL